LSEKEREQIISVGNNTAMGNARIEEKLEAILQVLSQKEDTQPQIINAVDNDSSGSAKVEEKLSAILQALRDQQTSIVKVMGDMQVANVGNIPDAQNEKGGIAKIIQVYMPFVLAVLLAVSIGVQVMMANRLATLERAQNSVTETQNVLLTDIKKALEK